MAYHSKYTGAEVDALLDKIKDDDVGDIDSSLSTTSENPVMNKVVTAELNKKALNSNVTTLETKVDSNKTATDKAISDLSAKVDADVEGLQTQLEGNGVLIEDLQESKADVSGYYPQLSVGQADNLPDRGDVTEGLIGFRESAGAGNSIEDGTANVKELLGESLVWNQHLNIKTHLTYDNTSATSVKYSLLGLLPYYTKAINGHKIFAVASDSEGKLKSIYFNDLLQKSLLGGYLFTASSTVKDRTSVFAEINAGVSVDTDVEVFFYDLTQMFGAGNEPSTIEEFEAIKNQIVGVDFNAYNEGEVLGVNINGIKSVNDNAWDEEWEAGSLSSVTGVPTVASSAIRAKDFIKVLPSSDYYVTVPTEIQGNVRLYFYDADKNFIKRGFDINKVFATQSNAHYMKLIVDNTTTYNHDICIRLAHSGYKTEYVPHEESESSFDLTPYFPNGMHGINGVRDSATPKKATRRIGGVDMSTLEWVVNASGAYGASVSGILPAGNNYVSGIIQSRYAFDTSGGVSEMVDKSIRRYGTNVYIKDSAYTDVASFKASLQGVILYYELAEPIETEIDPQLNMNYKVWDFGTEELLTDSKSAPVLARTIYGFNATDTIRGNKATIENHEGRITDLENEVVRVGDYQPDLSVGVADNLAGHEDATPSEIGFRRSGGGAILDGTARIESIKGNSVVWNQLVNIPTKTIIRNGVTLDFNGETREVTINGTADGDIAYPIADVSLNTNHYYYLRNDLKEASRDTYYITDQKTGDDVGGGILYKFSAGTGPLAILIRIKSGVTLNNVVIRPRFTDLTQMFEAGNEPTTIEEFYARIPSGIDEYAYNEGEVIHMDVQSIESVGVNQWGGELEEGKIQSGEDVSTQGMARSIGYINIIPNTAYYATCKYMFYPYFYDEDKNYIGTPNNVKTFTTPSNARYLRFFLYNSSGTVELDTQVCINLSDPSVNGKYFPYVKREQSLDIIGKYFPNGMKSAGSAHDEIRYNKATQKWEAVMRIAEVDLGTLNFTGYSITGIYYCEVPSSAIKDVKYGFNLLCARYTIHHRGELVPAALPDKSLMLYNGAAYPLLGINDSAYTDVASFKAAMQGVILYYELANPIVTEIEEAFNLDYEVWNGGTEQAIADTPTSAFKADIIYGFNAYGVIKELLARVASLEAANASLASQLASVTSHNEEV